MTSLYLSVKSQLDCYLKRNLMGILVAICPNFSRNRKSISILFAALEFNETAAMTFAVFCKLFGLLFFLFFFFQLVNEVLKFKIVEASVCLAKDLKNSFFLSQIYSLLSYLLFLSSSCLLFCFLFFNNTWYIFCSPHSLYVVSYIIRKPIVYKPPASSWASLSLPP